MFRNVAALLAAGMLIGAAPTLAQTAQDMSCVAPAGNPAPNTPEWIQRDTDNQRCAAGRNVDQIASPAFGYGNLTQGGQLYVEQWLDQAGDVTHPRGGLTTLVPGSKAADPFRTIERWTDAHRGEVTEVEFPGLNGAVLRGHVFRPPASVPVPAGGFPGVVITDGSVQAYEELYYWAAEDLAEAGYEVMTYDVQGQGDSDLAGSDCPGACTGVPYQQNLNFFQGAEDSLSFFLSDKNPWRGALDADRVGIAGHSLGAAAVSEVGQCDNRVKAIVAWDNLSAIKDCSGVTIAPQYRSAALLHAPAMALTNDYGFWTQPAVTAPDPHSKDAGYKQVAAAGLDAQIVALRNATHLTYSYIPLVMPANELSERMASYYTTAWFDRHLKGDAGALDRLTATAFDDSADRHSTGAGTFDPALAAASPTDRYAGNVPYVIAGIPVKDAVSFYYVSSYSLADPATGQTRTCADMRAGCS
ncbi:MAG: hypothetical protein JWM73_1848 [Solirubrobacterales bacterium]|nr:hypothetical protein [Solirubrobacterales bacterium]